MDLGARADRRDGANWIGVRESACLGRPMRVGWSNPPLTLMDLEYLIGSLQGSDLEDLRLRDHVGLRSLHQPR